MNDINTLMSRIDEINAKTDPATVTPDDIIDLIKYHRHSRARRAAGERAEKPVRPSVDVVGLLNLPAPKATNLPKFTRRF